MSLLFFILTLKLFFRNRLLQISRSIALIIVIFFGASIAYQFYDETYTPRGIIIQDTVVARKGNSQSYDQSFDKPLNEGIEFKLLEIKEDWYRIQLDNGAECWIPINSAELI